MQNAGRREEFVDCMSHILLLSAYLLMISQPSPLQSSSLSKIICVFDISCATPLPVSLELLHALLALLFLDISIISFCSLPLELAANPVT